MRLLSPRAVLVVALGLVASTAFAQANFGGNDRDFVARVIRGGVHRGVQRLDADGGHGTSEVADVTTGTAASPATLALDHVVIADLPAARVAVLAPTAFEWLPRLTPTTPRSEPFPADARGRAPPSR